MKIDVLVKELEKKYGNRAKVKRGKPYATMTAAKPSNSMGIVVLYKNGMWQEYAMSLDHSAINYNEVDTVCFLYIGNNYLTINTYDGVEVAATKGITPEWIGRERKEKVVPERVRHSGLRAQRSTHALNTKKVLDTKEPETSGLDEDIDVPW